MHDIESRNYSQEAESYYGPAGGGVFHPNQEMELASELMEVANEQELEQFLGDLIKSAGSALGSFVKSPVGQALGGVLKGVAKQALPMAGQALGGYLGGSTGAQIGGQLGSAASGMFEMESENEFEAAQSFVRLAADAVKNAASAPPGANPHAVAQAAVAQAAQVHAPGLQVEPPVGFGGHEGGHGSFGRGRSGRWIRRGGKIILLGA
jgi:hypothetical protein